MGGIFFSRFSQRSLGDSAVLRGAGANYCWGTDLVPEVKKQTREVKYLVDISGIEELKKIEVDGDNIKIGAGKLLLEE